MKAARERPLPAAAHRSRTILRGRRPPGWRRRLVSCPPDRPPPGRALSATAPPKTIRPGAAPADDPGPRLAEPADGTLTCASASTIHQLFSIGSLLGARPLPRA